MTDINSLIAELRAEADVASRSGQTETLHRIASRIEDALAEAWDEGREAEALSWRRVFDGHPVAEGEMCGECKVENPYRKETDDDR